MNNSEKRTASGGSTAGGASRAAAGAKWRTHGRGSAIDLTLTTDTASGRHSGVPSRSGVGSGKVLLMGGNPSRLGAFEVVALLELKGSEISVIPVHAVREGKHERATVLSG